MPSLQSLREARSIVRWMLVWFVLSIGVAVAAPVVNPQALTLICTTAGSVKFVSSDAADDGAGTPSGMQAHALDCVMCLPAGAPPAASAAPALHAAAPTVQATAPPALFHPRYADAASARGPPARV
jgi:hypothetical protein